MQGSRKKYISLVCWILLGCTYTLDKQAYMQWISSYEYGLHQQKEVGNYIFDVQYKPTLYKALQTDPTLNKEQLNAFVKEDSLEGMNYYDLKIGVKGGGIDILKFDTPNEEVYYQKQYYFLYEFAKDIYLEQEGKKYPCQLFHFERSYDLTPQRTFVLGFEKPTRKEEPYTLVINSKVLGTGAVKIRFEIKTLPELKF